MALHDRAQLLPGAQLGVCVNEYGLYRHIRSICLRHEPNRSGCGVSAAWQAAERRWQSLSFEKINAPTRLLQLKFSDIPRRLVEEGMDRGLETKCGRRRPQGPYHRLRWLAQARLCQIAGQCKRVRKFQNCAELRNERGQRPNNLLVRNLSSKL